MNDPLSTAPVDLVATLATVTGPAPKPAVRSTTMAGAAATLLSALATFALVWGGQLGPDAIGPAVLAIGGALASIIGRLRASGPIAGFWRTPS